MRSVPSPEQKEKARHGEQMFPLKQYITGLSAEHPAIPPTGTTKPNGP